MWRANIGSVARCETTPIAILGASQAYVDYLPREMGPSVRNYALPNSLPIDAYFEVERLLRCRHPPKYFILSYAPADFDYYYTTFWDHAGYGLLSYGDLNDIAKNSQLLHDVSLYSGAFGSEPPPTMKNWLYAYHFPPYDFPSILAAKLGRYRRRLNDRLTAETLSNGGQHMIGDGSCATSPRVGAERADFEPNEITTFYLNKMLQLFHKHHSRVVFISPPISRISFGQLKVLYGQAYATYVNSFKVYDPEIRVIGPLFRPYDNCLFADAGHLNRAGVRIFDDSIRSDVSAAFQSDGGASTGQK
jgi:hypothetical protein